MGFLKKETKVNIYKCDLCGAKIIVEGEEKEFTCHVCGRVYSRKDNKEIVIIKEGWQDEKENKEEKPEENKKTIKEDESEDESEDDSEDDILDLSLF